MLGERFVQRRAALDVGLDVENELLHRRLFVAVADDLEGLHQRNAGAEHGGELAAEDRDVAGVDLAAGLEGLRLLLDARRNDALAAQVGTQRRLAGRELPALDLVSLLVLALPGEGDVLLECDCCLRHVRMFPVASPFAVACPNRRQSTVTRLISSRLVSPSLTLFSPARRRSQTPSRAASSVICIASPPSMMMRPMASVTGMTW